MALPLTVQVSATCAVPALSKPSLILAPVTCWNPSVALSCGHATPGGSPATRPTNAC